MTALLQQELQAKAKGRLRRRSGGRVAMN